MFSPTAGGSFAPKSYRKAIDSPRPVVACSIRLGRNARERHCRCWFARACRVRAPTRFVNFGGPFVRKRLFLPEFVGKTPSIPRLANPWQKNPSWPKTSTHRPEPIRSCGDGDVGVAVYFAQNSDAIAG